MADLQERLKNVTRTQKAAVLMMLFGEQAAASILRNLSPREVQHLGAAMYGVGDIDSDTLDAVVEEFLGAVRAETGIGLGAADYVKTVMTDALGDEKAQSVISRINPMDTQKPIEILDWMDARAIAELISDEHPQIMALVIACLDYALAAEVLTLLPDDVQGDLVKRIASLNTVQPEPLKDLEQVMQRKFKQSSTMRASQIGGIKAAARILNFTRTDMEQRIMRDLRKGDKDMQQSIEESMFVFDNLIKSDDRSMQTLMRSVETELLVLALKGADEALKEKLLACMSTRAAANIRDEMEAMGPVRLTEVQNAQKEIVAVARRMADEGTIVLAGRGGEQMV
ncbi:flagellar motor switch protein FliG [Marivivens aquimaris]|uniref:flagellar motor switch protein FliG n=1 Tax=Marivivens aquimaris TaxID=2774876 RepID=UPI0018810CA0|nr:flagellar motor switch protein FliG [Marivivens aquimaris]